MNELDRLTILSFGLTLYALYIGLKNLQENRDQSNSQQDLLIYLESHLQNQDEHLARQDELMQTQAESLRKERE